MQNLLISVVKSIFSLVSSNAAEEYWMRVEGFLFAFLFVRTQRSNTEPIFKFNFNETFYCHRVPFKFKSSTFKQNTKMNENVLILMHRIVLAGLMISAVFFFYPLRPFCVFHLHLALSLFCCYFAIYSKRLTTIFLSVSLLLLVHKI